MNPLGGKSKAFVIACLFPSNFYREENIIKLPENEY